MGPSIGMNQSMENHTVENWKENLGTLHNEYLHLLKLKDAKLVLPAKKILFATQQIFFQEQQEDQKVTWGQKLTLFWTVSTLINLSRMHFS